MDPGRGLKRWPPKGAEFSRKSWPGDTRAERRVTRCERCERRGVSTSACRSVGLDLGEREHVEEQGQKQDLIGVQGLECRGLISHDNAFRLYHAPLLVLSRLICSSSSAVSHVM